MSGALKTYLEKYLPEARPVRNQGFGHGGVPKRHGELDLFILGNLISEGLD